MTSRLASTETPVDRYARDVVSGLQPAGKYHRLSCERHLKDRERENTPGFPFYFHWPSADRFLRFARQLKHYKGRQFAGQNFEPTEFQIFCLGSIFGWRQVETGFRRFTTAYNELPRKQGKSFVEAIVAVYCTFFEGEDGAEGYCLATKEKQALIVFDACKKLVHASGLVSRIKINAKNLNREALSQKLEPLGSDSDTTDGLNPHFIGVDELHAFRVRGLLDVMESATGARLNPMNFQITTAGNDPVSVCGDQHDYACRILDGVLDDDPSTLSFFACIAHADEDDDPWSEETWRKANPHWGISVNPEDMRKLAAKAQKMPSAAAEFKQKRLNLWVNASAPCLSVEGWKAGQSAWDPSELKNESCWVGLDLASKIDLMSMSFLFPPAPGRPRWRAIQHIWTPEGTLVDRAHKDRAPYGVWVEQKWLKTTPGARIDQRVILETLLEAREQFRIEAIGYDEWHADKLIEDIKAEGFDDDHVIAVPQTFAGMSSACLRLQADILDGLVDARKCPVTAWSVSNTVDQRDGKDNMMFIKKKSRGRIDPVVSMAIALALWLRGPADEEPEYQMIVYGGGPAAR